MIEERDYQTDAIDTLIRETKAGAHDSLVALPTGAGKTICFSLLLKKLYSNGFKDRRGMILMHRRDLVSQTAGKLAAVWPGAPAGVACGTLGEVVIDRPITVGTVQTLYRRREILPPADLVIIDEAHRLAPKGEGEHYRRCLEMLREKNPDFHLIGFTATPYRTNSGMIYNAEEVGGDNYFTRPPVVSMTISDLQQQGYLCPVRGMMAKTASAGQLEYDLKSVKKTAGEFNLGQLGEVMSQEIHVESAVFAYQEFGEGRRPAIVFGVDIEHARKLADAFRAVGHEAVAIHSKQPTKKRDRLIAAAHDGEVDILVNVGVLTEGFDLPPTELILLARPTLSPGLYVQMIGRGTRIAPGKSDCLVLDLSGNFTRHGHWSNPRLPKKIADSGDDVNVPEFKDCPDCGEILPIRTSICTQCGYNFSKQWMDRQHAGAIDEMVEFTDDFEFPINVVSWGSKYKETKSGNESLMLWAKGYDQNGAETMLFEFMLFDHPKAKYFAAKKWLAIAGTEPPESVDEARHRKNELTLPSRVWLRRNQSNFLELLLDRTSYGWEVRT